MVAVGAHDVVAVEGDALAVRGRVGDGCALALDLRRLDVLGLEDELRTEALVLFDEVLHECLLAVDGDGAAGELGEVDVVALPFVLQVDAVVREAVGLEVGVEAELREEVDRVLLEHPGADAAEHVLPAARLEDAVIDACLAQDVTQQQASRPGSDDRHLRGLARRG